MQPLQPDGRWAWKMELSSNKLYHYWQSLHRGDDGLEREVLRWFSLHCSFVLAVKEKSLQICFVWILFVFSKEDPNKTTTALCLIHDVPPPHLRWHSHPGQWGSWPIPGLWVVNFRRRDSLSEPWCCYKSWLWIPHFHKIISTFALWHQFSLPFCLQLVLLALTWIRTSPAALQTVSWVSAPMTSPTGGTCREPALLGSFRHITHHSQAAFYLAWKMLSTMQEMGDSSRLSTSLDLVVDVLSKKTCERAVCCSLDVLETFPSLCYRVQFQ